jgi:hypothetical protein
VIGRRESLARCSVESKSTASHLTLKWSSARIYVSENSQLYYIKYSARETHVCNHLFKVVSEDFGEVSAASAALWNKPVF